MWLAVLVFVFPNRRYILIDEKPFLIACNMRAIVAEDQ